MPSLPKTTLFICGAIKRSTVKQIADLIANTEPQDEITIMIHSDGGDEGCGRAAAGMLRACNRFVRTMGFGNIHSSAVLIFAAGKERLASAGATFLLHESSDKVEGNSTEIRKASKQMEADEEFWCKLLQDYTGTDAKVWMKLHGDEIYLRPDEALKLNLATRII